MKFFKLTSLKSQLLLILGGSLLLCSLSLVSFNYWSTKKQVKERFVTQELPALTDRVYKDMQARINEAQLLSESFVYNPFVIEWMKNGEQETKSILHLMNNTMEYGNIDILSLAVDQSLHLYYPEGLSYNSP